MKGLAKRNNKTRGKTLRRRKSRGKTARRRKIRGGGDDEDSRYPEWLNDINCEDSLKGEHTVPEDISKQYFQEMCRTELKLDHIVGGKKRKTHKKRK